jgi:hypothetical protein
VPGGSTSGETGLVATGHFATGEEAPGAAEHPARPASIKAAATIGAIACTRREGRLLQSCFTDIASPLDLCSPTLARSVQFHTASPLSCARPDPERNRTNRDAEGGVIRPPAIGECPCPRKQPERLEPCQESRKRDQPHLTISGVVASR